MDMLIVLIAGIALGTLVSEINSSVYCETFWDKLMPFVLAIAVSFLLCVFVIGLDFVTAFIKQL